MRYMDGLKLVIGERGYIFIIAFFVGSSIVDTLQVVGYNKFFLASSLMKLGQNFAFYFVAFSLVLLLAVGICWMSDRLKTRKE